MTDDYTPYKISVEAAPSWMYRPFKVVFATETPTGATSQAVYLDESERDALILALGGVPAKAEQGEPEWEYACSGKDRHGGGVSRFTDSPDEAKRLANRGYTIQRRTKAARPGPWLPVEENAEALTDGSER